MFAPSKKPVLRPHSQEPLLTPVTAVVTPSPGLPFGARMNRALGRRVLARMLYPRCTRGGLDER